MTQEKKLVILGSGPAGYSAGIYAARAGLDPVLITGLEMGGQLTTTTEVDNFPGYPEGVDGPKMMVELQQQAERFGTDVRIGFINKVEFSKKIGGMHKAYAEGGQEIEAQTIIISTGATAKYLGLPSEQRLRGGGVSACAVCDGFFYKGQEVAIVGGGDTAAEEATYLANICSKVTMLVRRDQMRASKAMQHRVNQASNIDLRYNSEIEEVLGTISPKGVEGVRVRNVQTGSTSVINCKGLFVAIGHAPASELVKGKLDLHLGGYVVTKENSTETSVPGVFAAGDITDYKYRQAVTSAGMGCMAALDAEKWLAEKK